MMKPGIWQVLQRVDSNRNGQVLMLTFIDMGVVVCTTTNPTTRVMQITLNYEEMYDKEQTSYMESLQGFVLILQACKDRQHTLTKNCFKEMASRPQKMKSGKGKW